MVRISNLLRAIVRYPYHNYSMEEKNKVIDLYIKDGILYGVYLPAVITLEVAEEVVKQRSLLYEGQTFAIIADIRNVKSVTAAARIFFSKPENNANLSAGALLVSNIFQETIGNIFIFFNKPPIPSKVFKKEEDAVKWLKMFN